MWSKFRKFMRQFDQFGQKVELKYKSKDTYRSACGGCVTIVVYAIMGLYALFTLYGHIYEPEFL